MTEVGIRCVEKPTLQPSRYGCRRREVDATAKNDEPRAARDEYEKRYTAATNGARWIAIYRKVIEAV